MVERGTYRANVSALPWPPDSGSRAMFEELAMARSPSARTQPATAVEATGQVCNRRSDDEPGPDPRGGRRW